MTGGSEYVSERVNGNVSEKDKDKACAHARAHESDRERIKK